MKKPNRLTADLNCIYPRWVCSVSDNKGTANGGFWKGFKSHADMDQWLAKNGYQFATNAVNTLTSAER